MLDGPLVPEGVVTVMSTVPVPAPTVTVVAVACDVVPGEVVLYHWAW